MKDTKRYKVFKTDTKKVYLENATYDTAIRFMREVGKGCTMQGETEK